MCVLFLMQRKETCKLSAVLSLSFWDFFHIHQKIPNFLKTYFYLAHLNFRDLVFQQKNSFCNFLFSKI